MDDIIKSLQKNYPEFHFLPAITFYWSPETKEIFYNNMTSSPADIWSLLHETGHALLEHTIYRADVELLRLEVDAWQKAQELADQLNLKIDKDHVQDCLDTYRDWLYRRSICPICTTKCLQEADMIHYRCFNCHAVWKVTPSRFCRVYRSKRNIKKPSAEFHPADGIIN